MHAIFPGLGWGTLVAGTGSPPRNRTVRGTPSTAHGLDSNPEATTTPGLNPRHPRAVGEVGMDGPVSAISLSVVRRFIQPRANRTSFTDLISETQRQILPLNPPAW